MNLLALLLITLHGPMLVPDSHGKFDFIEVDPQTSRLLASHAGNKTLDIFDSVSGKLLAHCPTGAAQGVAIDAASDNYYVSVSAEQKMVTVDGKTMGKTAETALPGKADVLAFDSKNGCAYVCHDDGTEVWVVDVKASKIVGTVTIPTDPEALVWNPQSDRVLLNIKSADVVAVIDPGTNKVVDKWATAPAASPHGLALDADSHHLFVVGGNGKLVMLDSDSGKLIASCDVAPKVDQIAFDPELKRIYCASGTGVLSVVQVKGAAMQRAADVPTHKGAHSVAVDGKTHNVWTAYADGEQSYIEGFGAK